MLDIDKNKDATEWIIDIQNIDGKQENEYTLQVHDISYALVTWSADRPMTSKKGVRWQVSACLPLSHWQVIGESAGFCMRSLQGWSGFFEILINTCNRTRW